MLSWVQITMDWCSLNCRSAGNFMTICELYVLQRTQQVQLIYFCVKLDNKVRGCVSYGEVLVFMELIVMVWVVSSFCLGMRATWWTSMKPTRGILMLLFRPHWMILLSTFMENLEWTISIICECTWLRSKLPPPSLGSSWIFNEVLWKYEHFID
jgi:hypothetical protein